MRSSPRIIAPGSSRQKAHEGRLRCARSHAPADKGPLHGGRDSQPFSGSRGRSPHLPEHSVFWRPCTKGKARFRVWLPSLFPALDCAWMLTYRWQMVRREHTTGVSITFDWEAREGMPEAPQGSPQVAGQCEGWVKAVTHGGFRLHVLTCDGMEVPQHWVLRLLPLLWSCITFPSWGY